MRATSDAADGLEADPRVDFVLAHYHRLRAEALDDGADVRADAGGGDEHRQLALLGGVLEGLLHADDELLQA